MTSRGLYRADAVSVFFTLLTLAATLYQFTLAAHASNDTLEGQKLVPLLGYGSGGGTVLIGRKSHV